MLYSLGSLYLVEQRFPDAEALFAESLSGFAPAATGTAGHWSCENLAFLDRVRGNGDLALDRYNEALVELRSVGDQVGVAHVLSKPRQPARRRLPTTTARRSCWTRR